MKSKMESKKIIIIGIIIIIITGGIFLTQSVAEENKVVETIQKEATVENQTITTTLTAAGEVKSANEEKLTLNTSYSYLNMCAEENEMVKKGDNLLKYTNGTYLIAPYDCVLLEYSVPTTKESCTESNYLSIASVENLYMDINIGEDQIGKISVGQKVDIVANYDETKTYKGTISKINAIGTHSSGGTTFAAITSIQNDGTLKLGMSATCTVTIEKKENVPCLPIEAIQIENNEKFVNTIKENGDIEKTKIETGISNANYVEIISGVSLEDKVTYETTTVTVISNNTEKSESKNVLSSLFGEQNDSNRNSRENFNRGGLKNDKNK